MAKPLEVSIVFNKLAKKRQVFDQNQKLEKKSKNKSKINVQPSRSTIEYR